MGILEHSDMSHYTHMKTSTAQVDPKVTEFRCMAFSRSLLIGKGFTSYSPATEGIGEQLEFLSTAPFPPQLWDSKNLIVLTTVVFVGSLPQVWLITINGNIPVSAWEFYRDNAYNGDITDVALPTIDR